MKTTHDLASINTILAVLLCMLYGLSKIVTGKASLLKGGITLDVNPRIFSRTVLII